MENNSIDVSTNSLKNLRKNKTKSRIWPEPVNTE